MIVFGKRDAQKPIERRSGHDFPFPNKKRRVEKDSPFFIVSMIRGENLSRRRIAFVNGYFGSTTFSLSPVLPATARFQASL